MNLYKTVFIISFIFITQMLFADSPIYIEGNSEEHLIPAENIEILIDSSGKYTLAEIISGTTNLYFSKNKDPFPHIINTNFTYWVKFSIIQNANTPKKNWVLEELDPHFQNIDLYIVDALGNSTTTKTGISLPFTQRQYLHKNFVFDIPLIPGKKTTVYARMKSDNNNVFLFKLRTTNFFTHYALNEYYILGIYYGILFIMGLYNILLFFTIKERVYLYYVLYVISCAFISFSEDGIGFHYFWPTLEWINPFIKSYSPLFFLLCFTWYAKSFLELNPRMPVLDKIIKGVALIYAVYFLLDLNLFPFLWDIPVYALPYFLIFISSIISFRKGYRPARFFIIANSIIVIAIIILTLRMNGKIGWDNLLTIYCFNIGIVFEIVILSIALGDKIKIIKSEKEKAQAKIIEQLKENEQLKDKVNLELEEKVNERTKEINDQKEIINDQNKELNQVNIKLQEQADEILRINSLLNEENKTLVVQKEELAQEKEVLIEVKNELEVNVKNLSKARILMKDVDFAEFSNIFPDKDSCMKYLTELKWQNGYSCVRCNNEKYFDGHEQYSRRCTRCGHDESATAYTIFHRLRFPINKAFYMLFLIFSNKGKITSSELSEIVTLRQSTCWSFRKKVQEKMASKKKGENDVDGWSWLVLEEVKK